MLLDKVIEKDFVQNGSDLICQEAEAGVRKLNFTDGKKLTDVLLQNSSIVFA